MHQEVPKNLRVPSIDLQAALVTVNESVHQATIKKQAAQIVQNGHLLRVLEGQSHSPDLNPVVMLWGACNVYVYVYVYSFFFSQKTILLSKSNFFFFF